MNAKRRVELDGLDRREFLKASAAAGMVAFCSGFPVTAFGQDKKPVKIGYSVSLTGEYAETGKYQQEGYELWKKHVNAKGGLLGRPLELVFYDDQSDPATGARLFEKLITDDKVDLIIGPYSSAITATAAQAARKYEMPMLTNGSSEKIHQQGNRYVFMIFTPAGHYLEGAFALAARHGLKTVAMINENTLFPKSTADGGVEVATTTYKLQVVFREEYPKGATDVSGILTKIKAINPDLLCSGSYFPDAVLIVRQMKELDVNPRMYAATVGVALDEFGGSKGVSKDAEYVYGSSQWEPDPKLPYPGIANFIAEYRKEFGRDPDYHSSGGYAAGEILEAAITKVGSFDNKKLRDAIAAMDMMTIQGQFKVDETGLQVGHRILLVQWQDGKKRVVWPDEFATAKARFPTPPWGQRR